MKLGERNFIDLTLRPSSKGSEHFEGLLKRPKHFSTADGFVFSHISKESIFCPITRAEVKEDALSITVQDANDTTNVDHFSIRLADKEHMELSMDGFPIEPFHLTRNAGDVRPATDWDETKNYPEEGVRASNLEMRRIFEEDQAVRQSLTKIDWPKVTKSDADRRTETRKLLNTGELHTGDDFARAAFLFQHGDTPEDYLLAHTLAMIAVGQGKQDALWIATATLDRYLQSVQRPQVFGTQFLTPDKKPTTQEPYDRTVVSDALRRQLGVPSQTAQALQRKQYDVDRGLSTAKP